MSDIEQIVYRAIEKYFAGRKSKRNGIVTSWDPIKHLAKVMYQPEGEESGWLPVHAMAAGNGYGLISGLSVGDQVEITHQEGEFDDGAITSRVHSEQAPAPTVHSGEQLLLTPWGSTFFLAQDGSVTAKDKSGASIKIDGSGNLTISGVGAMTVSATSAISLTSSTLTHNGHDIGSDHKHTGVQTGSSLTGAPQ